MTSARTRARLAAAVLASLVLLGACTGSPAPTAPDPSVGSGSGEGLGSGGGSTSSEGTTSGDGSASYSVLGGADAMRDAGLLVRSGDAALSVWPPIGEIAGDPDADGAVTLQMGAYEGSVDPTSVLTLLWVIAPEGSAFERLDDGSVLLHDATGEPVGALTAPVLDGAAAGSGARVQAVVGADGALEWQLTVPVRTDGSVEDAPGGTVTATFAGAAVREATWRDLADEGGRSLAVVPATWARSGSLAAEELVWAQLTAADAEADLPTMRDQLSCHLIGAPDKASWNLEPWRPDVGLIGMIGARCNPE